MVVIAGALATAPVGIDAATASAAPVHTCAVACVAVGDAGIVEGDSGTRTLAFPVTLSRPASATVTMKYRLQDLTATGAKTLTSGVDYVDRGTVLQTLTFKPVNGQTPTVKTIAVKVAGDTAVEGDEIMRVTLSALSGPARLARPIARGTIVDDDAGSGVRAGIGDPTVVEGDTGKVRNLQFPVTLSAPATVPVTLTYTVTGGTATRSGTAAGGGDYGGKATGTVKFALTHAGVTPVQKPVNFPVWADGTAESDKSVVVTLSAASLPSGVSIGRPTGTGTIVDDDAPATTVPVPNSMAALGDSISRGFNACPTIFGECLSAVWSTGTDTGVDSHLTRLLAVNPAIAGHAFNDAVSGAVMANLDAQAQNAVAQGVDYVAIEMGGNDVCKSTEAQMTSVATYQAQFQQALTTLTTGLPNAHVFVASVPDVRQLWAVGKDVAAARTAWTNFGICPTVTANPLSTAQADVDRRQRVYQRVVDYNTALATVCAQFTNCRFDGNIVFDSKFALSDVSTADYFHPSYAGQTGLAALTYSAGYDW
ncbi:MAG: SGNH/GDSL hydrolase family protein [Acidimicrobiia bacterium]